MRRSAVRVVSLLALAAAPGCGGGTSASPAPSATTGPATEAPAPALTPRDRAACNELEANIRIVSQLVSSSVEVMTQSLHPKELAKSTGEAQDHLLYAASVLSLIHAPAALVPAQHQLVVGLREFAADFGRAQKSVERNDIAKASEQLTDPQALGNVTEATQAIDRACGE